MKKHNKIITSATIVAASLAAAGNVSAAANPFGISDLKGGYGQIQLAEGKCGGNAVSKAAHEAKCGGAKADAVKKAAEGKCGEGKCGSGMTKAAEGKCGEGKCGADMAKGKAKKAAEGKCGEAKCGASK